MHAATQLNVLGLCLLQKLAATFAAKFSEQLDAYLAENAPQQPTTAGLCALRCAQRCPAAIALSSRLTRP